jgi:thiol-disulfide isomerase/thioredoxin
MYQSARNLFFILFFFIFEFSFAQSDCFKDCRGRSLKSWKDLSDRGITSTDSALAIDHTIIENLKGCAFPDAELVNYEGGKFTISQLKGNVVFVHLWFTTCATCIAEMPSINKLQEEFKTKNAKFLAISFNDKKTLETFFVKRGTFGSIQTFIDQKILESTFCILNGYPMNLVLDKNGKVIDAWYEENPEVTQQDEFYQKVKKLIGNAL